MTSYSNFSWAVVGIFAPPSSEQQLKVLGVEIPEGERRLNEHLSCPNGRDQLLLFIPFRFSPRVSPTWLTDPAFGIPRRNQTGN